MRSWKLTLIAAVLGAALPAAAGGPGGYGAGRDPEVRQQRRLERLRTELKLTDEQAAKVQALFDASRAQFEADRAAVGDDHTRLRELARERRREMQAKIDALLTDEQKARHAELREQHRARRGARRPAGAEK
jgi:Spy/CpxP family protein refolding chaperone